MRPALVASLMCLTVALGGCVAALVPVAAGGLMLRGQMDRSEPTRSIATNSALPVPARTNGAAQVALVLPAPSDNIQPAYAALDAPPVGGPLPDAPQGMVYLPAGTDMSKLAEFHAFARQALVSASQEGEARQSALLAKPEDLKPNLQACTARPVAVLIDLDPAGALASTSGAAPLASVLAREVSELRAENIAVVWISDRPASEASTMRGRLRETGLDPAGSDQLLLMRFPGETKQRRRQMLAQAYCIVALAGDERADFDDVYRFLRDPVYAQPLEPLIGDEWFLIPNPL